MLLSPREKDKLLVAMAATVARRRLERGVRLNYPESVTLIAEFVVEGARDGRSVAELMRAGAKVLTRDQVMEGVPEMIHDVQVEATFPDGTKLVTVHEPIRAAVLPTEEEVFAPWIGSLYETAAFRLLVVGESHFADTSGVEPLDRNFTAQVVRETAIEGQSRFFAIIVRVVAGPGYRSVDRAGFWDRVGFLNFVPGVITTGSRMWIDDSRFDRAAPLFRDQLKALRPTHVLLCGQRLSAQFRRVFADELTFAGYRADDGSGRPYLLLDRVAIFESGKPLSGYDLAEWGRDFEAFIAATGAEPAFAAWRPRPSRRWSPSMIPGEIVTVEGEIVLNEGQTAVTLEVANTGDRPVQVGSHYHFAETNPGLEFDRAAAHGMRLDIPAGTAVRFEPGQTRDVTLVPFRGARNVYGFRQDVMGGLE